MESQEGGYFLRARRNLILMSTLIIAVWTETLRLNLNTPYIGFPFTINRESPSVFLWMYAIQLYFIWRFSVSVHGKKTFKQFLEAIRNADTPITDDEIKRDSAVLKLEKEGIKFLSTEDVRGLTRKNWHAIKTYKVQLRFNKAGSKREHLYEFNIQVSLLKDFKCKFKTLWVQIKSSEVFSEVIFPSIWSSIALLFAMLFCLKNIFPHCQKLLACMLL